MATNVQDFLKKNPNYIGYANTVNRSQPKPKEEKKSKRGSGNQSWLSSIISELGGAGGALGGAAAGAAAGAPLGGVGALPGAVIGGLIGGFGGGFGGRALENQIRDKEMRVGDALKEGAVSGAFGAAGAGFQGLRGAQYLGKAGGGGVRAGIKGLGSLSDDAAKAVVLGGKKAGMAAGAGFTDDLFTAATKTAGKNPLERTGNTLIRNTLGIDDIKSPLKSGPKTLFQADDMLKEAQKLELKGTPKQMYRQVATQYTRFNEQVGRELAKSTATTTYDDIAGQATKSVLKKMPASDKAFKVEFTNSLDELASMAKKGKLQAKDIHNFKNSLNVDSAFRKMAGDLSSPLTAKETVDMALWKEADNWISKLAPAAKELTQRQSKMYGLSQGLAKMTLTPGDPKSLMELATRTLSPAVRRGQGGLGRALTTTGNIIPEIPTGITTGLGRVAKGTAARGIANQMMAQPEMGIEQGMEQMPEGFQGVDGGIMGPDALYGSQAAMGGQQGLGGAIDSYGQSPQPEQYNPYAPQNLQSSIAQIMQQGGDMGDVKDFLAIATSLGKLTETGGQSGPDITKVTGQQYQLAQRGATAVDQLEQLLASDPSVLNRSGTPGRKLPIVGGFISNAAGTGDFDAIGYNVASALLRIETGAQANPEEIKNLQTQMMPRAGDSPQTVQTKLQQLRQAFAGILNTANGSPNSMSYAPQEDFSSMIQNQYLPY